MQKPQIHIFYALRHSLMTSAILGLVLGDQRLSTDFDEVSWDIPGGKINTVEAFLDARKRGIEEEIIQHIFYPEVNFFTRYICRI